MTWIVVVVLGLVALAGLVSACRVSAPRRPASDATYVSNAMAAAGAATVSAGCMVVAAILLANA